MHIAAPLAERADDTEDRLTSFNRRQNSSRCAGVIVEVRPMLMPNTS